MEKKNSNLIWFDLINSNQICRLSIFLYIWQSIYFQLLLSIATFMYVYKKKERKKNSYRNSKSWIVQNNNNNKNLYNTIKKNLPNNNLVQPLTHQMWKIKLVPIVNQMWLLCVCMYETHFFLSFFDSLILWFYHKNF